MPHNNGPVNGSQRVIIDPLIWLIALLLIGKVNVTYVLDQHVCRQVLVVEVLQNGKREKQLGGLNSLLFVFELGTI